MEYRIENIGEKKLVGLKQKMSFANNKTGELWKNFMQRHNEITNCISKDKFSLQIYPTLFFESFNPSAEFEKWALMEVLDFGSIPEGMTSFILEGGLYAVFSYKGSSSEGNKVFEYIFNSWMPSSEYTLDNRPHFEILGKKYKNENPDSEEKIWIPIKRN